MDAAEHADAAATAPRAPSYAYKPSLLGASIEFRLTPTGMEWCMGGRGDSIPYQAIRRLRLSFRPVTLQSHRFLAEIWPAAGPKLQIASVSWRSLVEQERHDAAYSAFIVELNRRMAAAGGQASFETGSPAFIYWPGLAVFVVVAVALAALAVRALQVGERAGAALVSGFLGLFLWQVGTFFRRNRPSTYRPDAVPPEVLPRPL